MRCPGVRQFEDYNKKSDSCQMSNKIRHLGRKENQKTVLLRFGREKPNEIKELVV
jgi:hypothetical protein